MADAVGTIYSEPLVESYGGHVQPASGELTCDPILSGVGEQVFFNAAGMLFDGISLAGSGTVGSGSSVAGNLIGRPLVVGAGTVHPAVRPTAIKSPPALSGTGFVTRIHAAHGSIIHQHSLEAVGDTDTTYEASAGMVSEPIVVGGSSYGVVGSGSLAIQPIVSGVAGFPPIEASGSIVVQQVFSGQASAGVSAVGALWHSPTLYATEFGKSFWTMNMIRSTPALSGQGSVLPGSVVVRGSGQIRQSLSLSGNGVTT